MASNYQSSLSLSWTYQALPAQCSSYASHHTAVRLYSISGVDQLGQQDIGGSAKFSTFNDTSRLASHMH